MQEHDAFTLSAARDYWKHAPSALGKVNSEELMRLSDDAFHASWHEQYRARRHHYFEEKLFTDLFCRQFRGKRVLSFGSGLGFNEIQFLRAGAEVTCADIVETNLQVIGRVCAIEGHDRLSLLPMDDSSHTDFGGPYDFVYAWGSLMTMPFSMQREVMRHFEEALAPGGRMLMLLYTRAFLDAYCDEDSPTEFAKASDPSVGDCHNPWSDWHDDAKLLSLAPEMTITDRQFWNQDYYVTYGLARKINASGTSGSPTEFFRIEDEVARGTPVDRFVLAELTPADARIETLADGALRVTSGEHQYSYALVSETRPFTGATGTSEITLAIDGNLDHGGFSVGILDVERDVFVTSLTVTATGRRLHAASLDDERMPASYRLVVSNHAPAGSGARFVLHSIELRLSQSLSQTGPRSEPGPDQPDPGAVTASQ